MIYKTKVCLGCGQEYRPTGCRQEWCSECAAQHEKNRKAAWHVAHPTEYSTEYYVKHHETILAKAAVQRAAHPEKGREASAASAKAHPETHAKWIVSHPEQWAVARRKHQAKRRTLGFVPLNTPFAGCEAHHLNQTPGEVIYIPRELHHSAYHNQFSGQGMEQMNALALQWLAQNA